MGYLSHCTPGNQPLVIDKTQLLPLSSTSGILPLAWLHLRILLQNVLEQWYLCRLHSLPSLPQRFPSLPKCSTVEAPLQGQSHLIIPQPQQQGPHSLPLPFFWGSRIQPSGSLLPAQTFTPAPGRSSRSCSLCPKRICLFTVTGIPGVSGNEDEVGSLHLVVATLTFWKPWARPLLPQAIKGSTFLRRERQEQRGFCLRIV